MIRSVFLIRVYIEALNFPDGLEFPDMKSYVFTWNVIRDFITIILRNVKVRFPDKVPYTGS